MNSKKRKRDIISELNVTSEEAHLKVSVPSWLPCEICSKPCYNYRLFTDCITCSFDCYCILCLSRQNKMLDEKENETFEEHIKRIDSVDDMNCDDVSSKDSYKSSSTDQD